MPRQNFFQKTINIALILLFLTGCNAQANRFTPTPEFTATVKVFPTATATMMPTATATAQPTAEGSLYTAEKLSKLPTSVEDLKNLVSVPDPSKDKEGFTNAIKGILSVADEMLVGYTGKTLNVSGDSVYGVGNSLNAVTVMQDIPVIGTFTFPVDSQAHSGLGMVVPLKRKDGTLKPIVVVVDPNAKDLSNKQSREIAEVIAALTSGSGTIKFDKTTDGETWLSFGVGENLMQEVYPESTRQWFQNYTDISIWYALYRGTDDTTVDKLPLLVLSMIKKR